MVTISQDKQEEKSISKFFLATSSVWKIFILSLKILIRIPWQQATENTGHSEPEETEEANTGQEKEISPENGVIEEVEWRQS